MPQHRHPLWKRAVYSIALIVAVVGFGTESLHSIEHYSYLEAFFFMSMLATGQGPPIMPITSFGKIFTSIMAFISTGTVIFALGFIFGPFFGKLIRISEREIRKEEKVLVRDVKRYERGR